MRGLRLGAVAAGLGAALVLTVGALPATAAKAPQCLVVNTKYPDYGYTSLQAAVDDAGIFWGDTLVVQGTCTGTTVISTPNVSSPEPLTITGRQAKGFTAPTLDGAGQGPVLTIPDYEAIVVINSLTITGGDSTTVESDLPILAGGIYNEGSLTVTGSTIRGNTGLAGGGIANFMGTVTLTHSTISGNRAVTSEDPNTGSGVGGGLLTIEGTVTLNDSNINNNTADFAGGGLVAISSETDPSTVTLNGRSKINANTAGIAGGVLLSGGDQLVYSASLILNDSSRITNNTATDAISGYGGGVYLFTPFNTSLTLNDSSYITGNTAAVNGGGIAYVSGATLNWAVPGTGGNVYRNTPDDIFEGPTPP